MSQQYRPYREFKHEEVVEEASFSPAQEFEQQESWAPLNQQEIAAAELEEAVCDAIAPRKRKPRYWLRCIGVAVAALCGYEVVDFIWQQWLSSPWLGGFYGVVTGTVICAAGSAFVRELWKLRALKRGQDLRSRVETLLVSDTVGQALPLCEQLAVEGGFDKSPGYQRWLEQLTSVHNDREVLVLFSHLVLAERDKLARARVTKWSGEAAVMITVSPMATLDMLLLLWRNLKMIEELSALYGIELGYWSRIRLLKMVFHNMIFAGVTEMLTDVSLDLFSADLMAKVSGRLAQGLGAGLMTARLGFRTMAMCRPVPWQEEERPKLSAVRKQLLSLLKHRFKEKDQA
ncbi:YcjF family protein [Dongshaea marina]|uniref:YcjF family protein n=1 Tax=Dongshaea marina TaxID=2047966 RepID=UPI000D3E2288|nr:TIGR01620 family protein [Dongshaea marina]